MQWEYKTIKLGTEGFMSREFDEKRLEEFMNGLGGDGWELVVGLDTNWLWGETKDVLVIFKRPRHPGPA